MLMYSFIKYIYVQIQIYVIRFLTLFYEEKVESYYVYFKNTCAFQPAVPFLRICTTEVKAPVCKIMYQECFLQYCS